MTSLSRSVAALAASLLVCWAAASQGAPQHALTLYGEAPKYPADFKHFEFVNPDAPKGGTLRLAGMGGFDTFNPFISKGVAEENLGLIYETLTRHSLDEPFSEYGLLAEKIEKAADNSWVRFHINPKARFHDGQAVTAEDVVFSFQTLVRDGAPHFKAYYADVADVVVEAPLRVRFDFRQAGNRELPLIVGQLPVLPRHWWAERDFTSGNLEPPLGSGPYRIVRFNAGR